jgi:hypothetical protein
LKKARIAEQNAAWRQLTDGIELPLRPLHRLHLETVVEALLYIWQRLADSDLETIAGADEPLVNATMVNTINRQLAEEDPYLRRFAALVRGAERGVETLNYKGDRLELRPDILVLLKGRGGSFLHPLAVECKIIDKITGKTVRLYCNKGLQQFVEGDYGWARQEGVMLAYVRDGSTITGKLTPFLQRSSQRQPDHLATRRLPKAVGNGADQAESTHHRSFRYPGRMVPKDDPGLIMVRHIWLQPPSTGPNACAAE